MMRSPAVLTGSLGAAVVLGLLVWQAGLFGPSSLDRGRELAALYCGQCHIQPSPEILPKRSWEAALGYMGYWLGIDDLSFLEDHPSYAQTNVASRHEALLRENAFPAAPLLDADDWQQLRDFYVTSAPIQPLPPVAKPSLDWTLDRFDVFRTSYRQSTAVATTLVHIRESAQEVYLGDSIARTLTVLGSDGRVKAGPRRFRPDVTPVDLEFIGNVGYLASIGDLMSTRPPEERLAHIAALELVNDNLTNATATVALDDLYRMADMKPVDLNGDGRLDFIVCGFGAIAGSVTWHEQLPDGGFEEHVLINRSGAVKTEVHDFNSDGLLDVAVLLSDAREGLYIFENLGGEQFATHALFETHPAYGHTYFEIHDFNADGAVDFLVVNGDNVDSDPYNTPKNYHGIRIYLSRGAYEYEEAYFYPMQGAFVAKAADFDADGDLDIAGISFYPDFEAERWEGFVYLENDGDLSFSASSSEALTRGRWMTMDIGDLDGDADVDVVLGGGYIPVGMFGYMDLLNELATTAPPALILKNNLN